MDTIIKTNQNGKFVGVIKDKKLSIYKYNNDKFKDFDSNLEPNENTIECEDFAFVCSFSEVIFAVVTTDKKNIQIYSYNEENENFTKIGKEFPLDNKSSKYSSSFAFCGSPSTMYFTLQLNDGTFIVNQIEIELNHVENIPIRRFYSDDVPFTQVKFAGFDKIWVCQGKGKIISYYDFYQNEPLTVLRLSSRDGSIVDIFPSPVDENFIVVLNEIESSSHKCELHSYLLVNNEKESRIYPKGKLQCDSFSLSDYKFQIWSPFGTSFGLQLEFSYYEWNLLPGYRWTKPKIPGIGEEEEEESQQKIEEEEEEEEEEKKEEAKKEIEEEEEEEEKKEEVKKEIEEEEEEEKHE